MDYPILRIVSGINQVENHNALITILVDVAKCLMNGNQGSKG